MLTRSVKSARNGVRAFSAVVPKRMKYVAHDESIGASSLTVKECDTPSYNPKTERLVKVEASAVNRADLL